MRIVIDCMGGDHAPQAAVLGACDAAEKLGLDVILVGREPELRACLADRALPDGSQIVHAEDVVDMHDDPATVIKKRKDSSMIVGLRMLAEGKADAFVSAGSTGALLSAATLIVKRIRGIRRAAMCPVIPTKTGSCVLIDCGANAECTPEFLLQFAFMGSFAAKKTLGVEKPRVALLNIGTEDTKGGELQTKTYALLRQAAEEGSLHFIGNIEARDVPLGGADVVVADGFSGNVLLKSIEGTALFMASMVKGIFKRNIFTMLCALVCGKGIGELKRKMDYRETGGTPLLGITKPVIKAHGSSDRLAIFHAIRQAAEAVQADVAADITAQLGQMTAPKEN